MRHLSYSCSIRYLVGLRASILIGYRKGKRDGRNCGYIGGNDSRYRYDCVCELDLGKSEYEGNERGKEEI